MKTLWEIASLACLLIGLCPAGTYRQCSSPQYAEIGQQGTVECVFPANFSAIVWYDSEDTRGSQVARIERQADKSLRISENSAEGGTYRIALNGSLIIPLVSTHHDRNFTVFIVDENSAVSTFVIKLITVVYPNADAPLVNSCEGHSPCLVHAVNETHLSCTYKHARPAVILSWYHYKSSEGKLEPLIATQQSFREDGVTFRSVLNIYIANMTSNVLSLFTCEAVGPALKGKMETNVLVTNALSERCVSCRNEIPKRNVILDTLLEIPCIDNGIPYAYVWQLEQHKRSQTLVSSVKNKANFRDDINIAMNVSKEGALIISRVNFRVTGIYTCFSVGVGISSAHSVEVKVQAFSDGSSTSGRTVALIMAVIASILFLAVFVGLVVAIVYRKKIQKYWYLRNYEEMAETIKCWSIQSVGDPTIFRAEVMRQLRDVGDEVQKKRKEGEMAVTSGASSTTLGGFFPIIVLSELAGLAARGVAGAAGVAGAGLSIVSPLENLVNDTNRLVLVKPALQKFVNMQKDLAGAVVFLAIVYEMIRSQEREKYFTNCTMAALRAFYRKIKKCVSTIEPFEVKLSNIKKMAEELVDISYLSQCKTEDTSLQAQSWWKEDMKKLTDKPFDYLENALKTILRGNKDVKSVPTFSTFIRHLFVSSNMTEECQVSYTNTTQRVHNYAQLSDDAAKVGANVAKIARGVQVAGVVLTSMNVRVNLAFLGHASFDLPVKDKQQFSQALYDTADVMDRMNEIASNICVRRNQEA